MQRVCNCSVSSARYHQITLRILVVFLLWQGGEQAFAASGAEAVRAVNVTRPMPIRMEDHISPSPLFISYTQRDYGGKPSTIVLAGTPPDSADGVLHSLLAAISSDDSQRFLKLSDDLDADGAAQLVRMYREWLGTKDPKIKFRIDAGGAVYYVLEGANPQIPLVQVVLVKKEGKFVQSFAAVMSPVLSVFSELIRGMSQDPEAFAPVKGREFTNTIDLGPQFGEKTNAVTISFDLCRPAFVAYPLQDPSQDSDDAASNCLRKFNSVLTFYSKTLQDFNGDKRAEFQSAYGPKSRERLAVSLKDLNTEKLLSAASRERRVVTAIAGANDSYMLFLDFPLAPGDDSGKAVSYVIVRNQPNNKFQIVNFEMLTTFDDLLGIASIRDAFREAVSAVH
jgi:hypothetical protein